MEGYGIPLMMIQINVENAIEHGIRNNKNGGTVVAMCDLMEDFIESVIEDDRVGREVAQPIGSRGDSKWDCYIERYYEYLQ